MDRFNAAAALLPERLRRGVSALPREDRRLCEELRLRRDRPATALIAGREKSFCPGPVTGEELDRTVEAACRASLHAAEEQLRRGFISAPGGIRVGVCGTAVEGSEGPSGLRVFSSLCLRVPRAVPGCADGVWDAVTAGGFRSLLILSPPGAGKTTLLRELIRRLSDSGMRVCAADERGELADAASGVPGFDVGPHTDVMTGMAKAPAVMAMLRAMDPQVIAMDEVTEAADTEALMAAAGCGVELIATVHGGSPEDIRRRPVCRALLKAGIFRRCVTVTCIGGRRCYQTEELP